MKTDDINLLDHAFENEEDFQSSIIEEAKLQRWAIYHTYRSDNSDAGYPDLHLVRGQAQIFVELKMPGKDPTTDQRRWLVALEATGAQVYVWRPADMPKISTILETGMGTPWSWYDDGR